MSLAIGCFRTVALLTLLSFGLACQTATTWRVSKTTMDRRGLASSDRFVRAHLRDGSLVVLSRYGLEDGHLVGHGRKYDLQRRLVARGSFTLTGEEIALLESADLDLIQRSTAGAIVGGVLLGLVIITGLTAAIIAATGSCPTFYRDGVEGPVAEAFSHAMARPFAHRDIDAIGPFEGESFELTMRNEFPETHYVQDLKLASALIPSGFDRVRRVENGSAIAVRELGGPTLCFGLGQDCAPALAQADRFEASVPADPEDLAASAQVELDFGGVRLTPDKRYGLALTGHRSLMGTWMLYRMFQLLGDEAGHFMARLEREPALVARVFRFGRAMGALEVFIETPDGWHSVGDFREVGPMAADTQLLPLPEGLSGEALAVRLEMARGFFVLDAVQLVELGPEVELEWSAPSVVEAKGLDAAQAAAALRDPERPLITLGGQSLRLAFALEGGRRELFLDATGFYHEWIRPDWADNRAQDLEAFERYLDRPMAAFRDFAPVYKHMEPWLEDAFWAGTIRAPL
ncbi:MAG: hypothetical protein AAGD10_18360 [Myxococcota bacterium]